MARVENVKHEQGNTLIFSVLIEIVNLILEIYLPFCSSLLPFLYLRQVPISLDFFHNMSLRFDLDIPPAV